MDINTAVPSNIYALNLAQLSALVGCSEDELIRGMHTDTARDLEAVVVDRDQTVPFETLSKYEETKEAPKIKQVLITAAARPSVLDTFDLPKCLIELGGRSILSHIISHLYAVGIERIVISVAYCGEQIVDAVQRHPYFEEMQIEFLDLGADNREGHARSILAAKHWFTEPFLIHTADHIFDNDILHEMMTYDLSHCTACVLIERELSIPIESLPKTSVKVKVDGRKVIEIDRKLTSFDGIDAGLFSCHPDVFVALEEMAKTYPYFSFANALNIIAPTERLEWLGTQNRTWFSIETEEQLAYAVDHKGDTVLSPWTVFVARPPPQSTPVLSSSAPAREKSIYFSIPDEPEDRPLHVMTNENIRRSDIFSGFIVGVGHVSTAKPARKKTPLLQKPQPIKRYESTGDRRVVAIPFEETKQTEIHEEAYLIELPPSEPNKNHELFLAVPETVPTSPMERGFSFQLPSDVTNIKVETYGPKHDIQMVVKRKVPPIGYALLVMALFTISSVGAVMDMQTGVAPILKVFWRMSSTAMCLFPFAAHSVYYNGPPVWSWSLLRKTVVCGMAYSVFSGAFIMALDLTSLSDAYIFANSHSLIIVFGKMFMRLPLALLEGCGAIIGLVGAILCTMDQSGDMMTAPHPMLGDLISFIGAVCGVVYLTIAKDLRSQMNLFVFMFGIMATGSCVLFCYSSLFEASSIEAVGYFGWAQLSSQRLPIELYLIFICNFLGTMGYVSVMKYFDAIVISVVMLLEPAVAAILGIVFGVSGVPGIWTFIGGFTVMFGTFLVIWSAKEKTQEIDITEALHSTRGEKTKTF